jgi:hypothetical protein
MEGTVGKGIHAICWWENLVIQAHLEYVGVGVRIIKTGGREAWAPLVQNRTSGICCKHGNKHSNAANAMIF